MLTPDPKAKTQDLEFFAAIKLVTNEEIIGFVNIPDDLEEQEDGSFYITDPLVVRPITIISGGKMIMHYQLSSWMSNSSDNTFCMNQKDVVVWGDMSPTMFEYYNIYLNSVEYSSLISRILWRIFTRIYK
jgi:activator of HSP90 ATPase